MHLYLTNRSPLHSSFALEDGQVLYKVESEYVKLGKLVSNISRAVPNEIPRKEGEEDMRDRFARLAQIEYRTFESSVIRYGGNEIKTSNYFRKEGWGPYGRHRVFRAPDGREYKWLLRSFTPKLVINDRNEEVVAKFHRKVFGIFGKPKPASLEILPAGEHLIETIIVTFIYIEKIRKDKERAAR